MWLFKTYWYQTCPSRHQFLEKRETAFVYCDNLMLVVLSMQFLVLTNPVIYIRDCKIPSLYLSLFGVIKFHGVMKGLIV